MHTNPISICWLRRDLRLFDNAALYHALRSGRPVLCLFIFDSEILNGPDDRNDRRVSFIHESLTAIKEKLVSWRNDEAEFEKWCRGRTPSGVQKSAGISKLSFRQQKQDFSCCGKVRTRAILRRPVFELGILIISKTD